MRKSIDIAVAIFFLKMMPLYFDTLTSWRGSATSFYERVTVGRGVLLHIKIGVAGKWRCNAAGVTFQM